VSRLSEELDDINVKQMRVSRLPRRSIWRITHTSPYSQQNHTHVRSNDVIGREVFRENTVWL
jgi:hypothetical protein